MGAQVGFRTILTFLEKNNILSILRFNAGPKNRDLGQRCYNMQHNSIIKFSDIMCSSNVHSVAKNMKDRSSIKLSVKCLFHFWYVYIHKGKHEDQSRKESTMDLLRVCNKRK